MSSRLLHRLAFGGSGLLAFGCSYKIFMDLTDFSQIILPNPNKSRNDFLDTYAIRHQLAASSIAGSTINTAAYFAKKRAFPRQFIFIWAGVNALSLGLLFAGYINPEFMMRPRNHNALYMSTEEAKKLLKPSDTAVITQIGTQSPRAYPDAQIMRPHIVRVGEKADGTPVTIAYCALTGTGVVYETPNLPNGKEREFIPYIQLENNLVVLDKTTGHIGHQINGLDETKLIQKMGTCDYNKVGRRPSQERLKKLGVKPATEIASWRMSVGDFIDAFEDGQVFINDYREFPQLTKPVKTMYDALFNFVFDRAIGKHNVADELIFKTVDYKDKRLALKQRVWGCNVGDDYCAITEEFVKEGENGVRNFNLGGQPLVASYDAVYRSLGIWKRPNDGIIDANVDVYGRVNGRTENLERLNTVKAGLFWFVWQNFFPQTDVNPIK
eukprot:289648_1